MLSVLNELTNFVYKESRIAPFAVLLYGVLTSFSPCCLSSVPLILGYVGGKDITVRKSLSVSTFFSLGFITVNTLLGIFVAYMNKMMSLNFLGNTWFILLAILLFFMGFQALGVITLIPSTYLQSRNTKRGSIGAWFTGVLAGVFSSPCSTPMLVALLVIASQSDKILWGGFLLLLYGVGHSVLFYVVSLSVGFVKTLQRKKSYQRWIRVFNIASAGVIFCFAFYFLYLAA
ncbi:Thiol:disulfide interchange protein DsbD precursor [compost metagenome]